MKSHDFFFQVQFKLLKNCGIAIFVLLMTEEQDIQWQRIESEIYSAFKDVKLEDGIGYYEAGALDDYLKPADEKYQIEKSKDERNDWRELLTDISETDIVNDRHCFMDAIGLRFYLPFLIVRRDTGVNSIMHFYISEFYKREGYSMSSFTETVEMLTSEQKKCIYHFYEFLSRIEDSGFYEEDLDSEFAAGEIAMKGFDYVEFKKKQFDVN